MWEFAGFWLGTRRSQPGGPPGSGAFDAGGRGAGGGDAGSGYHHGSRLPVGPDQIRRDRAATGPWHYVDIPIDKPHLDMARDCPKGDCVIAKIEEFQKVVVDPAATPVQRKEALMFLVHFVGDMHQPLHCSDNKDKGGNDVKLDFFGRPSNLHSVWDSGLLGRIGTGGRAVRASFPKT